MRTPFSKVLSTLIFGISLSMSSGLSQAADSKTVVESILKDYFSTSQRVVYETVETKKHSAALKKRLGYTPRKENLIVFMGVSGTEIDGYAIVDNEMGRFDPITFAVKISPSFNVVRTDVIVYRGPRGKEIMEARFLNQFQGKAVTDPIKLNMDIDVMSGATISSNAATQVVKRALAIISVAYGPKL